MKKIFIPTPLTDNIIIPKDITHHILHVFRHDMRKPVTVSGSDGQTGSYLITAEIDGAAYAQLCELLPSQTQMSRVILVQSLLKGEKLEWVLQKATELNVDAVYFVATANNVVKYLIATYRIERLAYLVDCGTITFVGNFNVIVGNAYGRVVAIHQRPEARLANQEVGDILRLSSVLVGKLF